MVGFEARAFLKRLEKLLTEEWEKPYSIVRGFINARISIALVRATNRCIRGFRTPASTASMAFTPIETLFNQLLDGRDFSAQGDEIISNFKQPSNLHRQQDSRKHLGRLQCSVESISSHRPSTKRRSTSKKQFIPYSLSYPTIVKIESIIFLASSSKTKYTK